MTCADSGIYGEVVKCVAILSNRLSAIKAVNSERTHSSELKNCNETSDGSVGKSAESGTGARNVVGSSR